MMGSERRQKDREIKSEREMFYGFKVIITQTTREKHPSSTAVSI